MQPKCQLRFCRVGEETAQNPTASLGLYRSISNPVICSLLIDLSSLHGLDPSPRVVFPLRSRTKSILNQPNLTAPNRQPAVGTPREIGTSGIKFPFSNKLIGHESRGQHPGSLHVHSRVRGVFKPHGKKKNRGN